MAVKRSRKAYENMKRAANSDKAVYSRQIAYNPLISEITKAIDKQRAKIRKLEAKAPIANRDEILRLKGQLLFLDDRLGVYNKKALDHKRVTYQHDQLNARSKEKSLIAGQIAEVQKKLAESKRRNKPGQVLALIEQEADLLEAQESIIKSEKQDMKHQAALERARKMRHG